MLQRLGRSLQRVYSSFNTCSSAPKGGWVRIHDALIMPKLPVFMIWVSKFVNHSLFAAISSSAEITLDATTTWHRNFRRRSARFLDPSAPDR